jgi:hypothetical protein
MNTTLTAAELTALSADDVLALLGFKPRAKRVTPIVDDGIDLFDSEGEVTAVVSVGGAQ